MPVPAPVSGRLARGRDAHKLHYRDLHGAPTSLPPDDRLRRPEVAGEVEPSGDRQDLRRVADHSGEHVQETT